MENKIDVRILRGSEIVIGDDVFDVIPSKISEVSKEGAILVVYDKNLKEFALKIGDALRLLSRRIFLCELDKNKSQDENLPDYIRFIIAVGCGFASQKADALASRLNVLWSLFLTAPTADTVLQHKSPKHVFISRNVMINCPKRCLAAGYGMIYSQELRGFESRFADKILSLKNTSYLPYELNGDVDVIAMTNALLEISLVKDNDDSADMVAKILYAKTKSEGRKPRLIGEYKFVASSYLLTLYSAILGSPAIDVSLPPVRDEAIAQLEKIGVCHGNMTKSIDFFDLNSYFKINYILQEYRTDLLEKLSSADTHKAQRIWRRIYDDAGYWLKSELTVRDLKTAAYLAASQSDNLLGYAYASGVLTQ